MRWLSTGLNDRIAIRARRGPVANLLFVRDRRQPRSRLYATQAMPKNQYIQAHYRDHAECNCVFHFVPTSLSIVSAINAGVTPTVAPTTALLGMKLDLILCCDRNVTRILRRRLYTWSDTARIEVLIHR